MSKNKDQWKSDSVLPRKFLKILEGAGGESVSESFEEISERLIQFFLNWFPVYFKKNLGVKIRLDESDEEMRNRLTAIIQKIFFAIKKASELPEGKECQAVEIISEPYLEILNDESSGGTHKYRSIFEYLVETHRKILFQDVTGSYLQNTDVLIYRKETYDIIDRTLANQNFRIELYNILNSKEYVDQIFFIQGRIAEFLDIIKYLNHDFRRFTEPTVYRIADLYHQLAEMYSKLAIIVRVMHIFIESARRKGIVELLSESLSNRAKAISSSKVCSHLGRVDTVIRNSVAHESHKYDPGQKSILFADRKSSELLKPAQLLQETRDLSGLVLALLNIQNYIQYKELLAAQERCTQQDSRMS